MYFQKIQTTLLKQHYQTPLKLQTSYIYIYIKRGTLNISHITNEIGQMEPL